MYHNKNYHLKNIIRIYSPCVEITERATGIFIRICVSDSSKLGHWQTSLELINSLDACYVSQPAIFCIRVYEMRCINLQEEVLFPIFKKLFTLFLIINFQQMYIIKSFLLPFWNIGLITAIIKEGAEAWTWFIK